MTKQDDGLFLLEALVDKVVFVKSPCFSDKDFRTCVNIECLSIEPLEICDDDPGACTSKSMGPFVKNFNSGKSCLFSLKESDITNAMSKFPIKVSIYKSLPCGCLPTKIVMGETTIDMTKEFVEARKNFLADPNNVSYQALKDSFRIFGPDGTETGEIVMFLRISCFGKLIITRFQGGGPPALSAGGGSSIVDRSCNPQRDFQTNKDPCACGAARGNAGTEAAGGKGSATCTMGGGTGKGTNGVCPPARDPYNIMPCQDPDDPCYCTGPKPSPKEQMACRNTDQYCLHIPKGRSKQFEEIGTNLGGNELKIKVPASASIVKKISQTHCAMSYPYAKGVDGGPCEPPCGKNQISLALPNEDICCQGARLADTQFTCTTEGCTQASKHGQQSALARGDIKNDAPGNKNTFVLKVAKTAMQGDRKCKLEVELVTPKGPDKIPPVEKVNTRLQSDLDYCCPTGNKVIFQMPSDTCGMNHKQRVYFNMNSDGVGDMARDEPGQLMPSNAEGYPGVIYDFPDQVIKLRVGKTIEMPGDLPNTPYTQEITAELKLNVMATMQKDCIDMDEMVLTGYNKRKYFENFSKHNKRSSESYMAYEKYSTFTNYYKKPRKHSISFFNKVNSTLNSRKTKNENEILQPEKDVIFGTKETAVYMTLYDDLFYNRTLRTQSTAGTQATASINKCLQIQFESNNNEPSIKNSNSCSYYSSCTMTTLPYYDNKKIDRLRYSDVYFFGRKRDSTSSEKMEMGKKGKHQRSGQTNSMTVQTNKVTGASTGTCTKTVSIKDEKTCNENTCPAIAQPAKGEMVATVSHIKLGPREPCPIHGRDPCQGPKCIVASSGEEKAPVKVTTLSNPRRGVFELVIRRITGAPLAKNELMLEWTPPPCQPSCGQPCILPCSPVVPSCYPTKCKMILLLQKTLWKALSALQATETLSTVTLQTLLTMQTM
ncbi:unnamed protein product [Diatraea saccharalis]|uniref:Uncharacterized protein n=1 Tax=Diatraea saccharalis TaxID=40085 RepID=A0A9N9N3L7_9NEOP|nr:unnamed protein product [Diatraea saccharalis]